MLRISIMEMCSDSSAVIAPDKLLEKVRKSDIMNTLWAKEGDIY